MKKEIKQAIKDIKFFSKTHIDWAIYFEENPNIEKEHTATGEWDSAKQHRKIVTKYDNILKILTSHTALISKLEGMKDNSGKKGCTYGDTDYDSESVCYGFNEGIDLCIKEIKG